MNINISDCSQICAFFIRLFDSMFRMKPINYLLFCLLLRLCDVTGSPQN